MENIDGLTRRVCRLNWGLLICNSLCMKVEGMTRNVGEWYRVAFNGDVLWKSTARQ